MHLPFLQVPDDVWPKARTLARILRVPEFQGIGLAVALDAWALQCATDGDVSGLIDDPNPSEAIALAVGWEGDAAVLFAALVRVRLVEKSPDGARVTTLEKYAAAVVRPGKRSEAASKAATERWQRKRDAERMESASASHNGAVRPDTVVMRPDAKMESKTQMQTEIKNLPASQAANAADAGEDLPDATADAVEVPERPALELLPSPPDVPEKPAKSEKKLRAPSKAEALVARLEDDRRKACDEAGVSFVPQGWGAARINSQLGAVAKADEAEQERFAAAWDAYRADNRNAAKDPPYCMGFFLASRSTWESRALRASGGAA